MSLFSQRKGIRPVQKAIQREAIDDELRNRLWSALKLAVFDNWSPRDLYGHQNSGCQKVDVLVRQYWLHYFKRPIDTIPSFDRDHPQSAYDILREHFLSGTWWQSYDFIEFTVKNAPDEWGELLKDFCNNFLQAENAAYRIVDKEIVEITDENEIEAIESAIEVKFRSISEHLKRSLEMISDKKEPDYRNAVKEAISAVESACRLLSGDEKATLGAALKKVDAAQPIHPAFKDALSKLYGYTSDSDGIRHSLTEGSSAPSYADAKFMLVSASAFINFLWTKSAENGITIQKA